jgi:hypothetical protein
VPGGNCGSDLEEPFVLTLPIPPDDYCEPEIWPVTECVLDVHRYCGPPEQSAEQSIYAELWEGGIGSMSVVIIDTLNHGANCEAEYTCTVDKL